MREVVIASSVRTPIGSFQGTLSDIRSTELGKLVILEALRRAQVPPEKVDEVIMGIVLPAGLGQNPARQSVLLAGLPYEIGAISVNKVCGSGLKAVMLAAQAIQTGDADLVVAGGMESMTRAPYFIEKARGGLRMGHGTIHDSLLYDGLWDQINDFHMGVSAELCAEKYNVSRSDQDKLTVNSYEKALAAIESGRFKEEILPVEVKQRKKQIIFDTDELPRETSMETLSKMPSVFQKDGTVTAGNSSKISDGAAALVIMSRETADELKVAPVARIVAQASSGIDPKYVLMAPILAIPKVLKKAGLAIEDIDLFEINEAFASSSVGIMRELDIPEEKINVNGGAVALGHPIGASGARVLTTLLHAMGQRSAKLGLASLCLGGGEAVALIVEAI
jgi:acetyl-CoA C-acetyltransferase